MVPLPQEHLKTALPGVRVSGTRGHWRGGILDVFQYRVRHPACWTGWACHLREYTTSLPLASGSAQLLPPIHPPYSPTHSLTAFFSSRGISRLILTWWGCPGTTEEAAVAHKVILAAVVGYWVVFELLGFIIDSTKPNHGKSPYAPKIQPSTTWFEFAYLQLAMWFVSWIGATIVSANVRTCVRQKDKIPASDSHGLEDWCCSCW